MGQASSLSEFQILFSELLCEAKGHIQKADASVMGSELFTSTFNKHSGNTLSWQALC